MTNKDVVALVATVVVITTMIAGPIGYFLGRSDGIRLVTKQAIEKGFAQYNPQTANFEWKQNVQDRKAGEAGQSDPVQKGR